MESFITRVIVFLSVCFTVLACSTTKPTQSLEYKPAKFGEIGYFNKKIEENQWYVGYIFNSLEDHAPQQLLNLIMLRAVEIAERNNYIYLRMLPRDDFKSIKPGGTPYLDLESMKLRYPENIVSHVGEGSQPFRGTYERTKTVRYFEFSREIVCGSGKCSPLEYDIESCMSDYKGFAEKTFIKLCGSSENVDCIENYSLNPFLGNPCLNLLELAFYADWNASGWAEESSSKEWYKVSDIKDKYLKRSKDWKGKRKLLPTQIKRKYFSD